MGKIKKIVLRKQDRPVTEPKPPSMRKYKRRNHISNIEQPLSLRGLKRGGGKAKDRSNMFAQVMPETLLFRFKKNNRPTESVVHEHYSDERADKTSSRRVPFFTCDARDSEKRKQMELLVEQKLGKIEIKKAKSIWHRVDKQDIHFKI